MKATLGQYADLFDFGGLSSEMGTTITVGGREVRSDITAFIQLKESAKRAGIFLLVEHKAQKNPSLLLVQLLGYMASMLNKQQDERGAGRPLDPVLALVVYNGKVKVYKGPKELRELYSTEKIFKEMRVPVLNFGYVLLNVHDPGGQSLNTADENSFLELVFFAMRKIFDLKGKGRDEILKELFSKGEKLSDKVWEKLMQEIGEYIMNVHPDISVKILSEAEEKAAPFIKKKRRKVMQMLKTSVERAKEQGLEQGLEKGREEERREIALNFLEAGIDPRIVAKNTGLSLQAVKSLLKTPSKRESP